LFAPIISAQLPKAELVTIPACGHRVHVDEPEAVLEAIDRFLPRLES